MRARRRARTSSPHDIGPAVAPGFPAAAASCLFVDFVVEQELALGGEVVPAIGVEDGAIHGGVKGAEFRNPRVALLGVVEAVVGPGEALAVLDHEGSAEVVVCRAGGFEGGMGFPAFGEREGFEAVGSGPGLGAASVRVC